MRLNKHLTEASRSIRNVEATNIMIHERCGQYLKLIRGKDPLYRGMSNEKSMGIKDVRKDRIPYGMSEDEADYLNNWLGSNGHARRDQSVLCTSNKEHIELFGGGYMIFPLDKIKKYTWFDGMDINMDNSHLGWEKMTVPSWMTTMGGETYMSNDYAEEIISKLTKPFDKFFHTNKGFSTAHKNGYEMWVDCRQYIFVGVDWYDWDKTKQVLI